VYVPKQPARGSLWVFWRLGRMFCQPIDNAGITTTLQRIPSFRDVEATITNPLKQSKMAIPQLRAMRSLSRAVPGAQRTFRVSAFRLEATTPATTPPVSENQPAEINQAPNRLGTWSRSQKPRSKAMTGPRFEQTDFDLQVPAN
jgi:hypothetical protein